jgi:hypothetical protein
MATTTDPRRREIRLIQTIFAGVAAAAMLVLFHNALPADAKTVGAAGSVRLIDRATDLPNRVGAGGWATDGDDDEAQLQQQLAGQEVQQAEQQAEEQEQLDLQEAQQAEQQGQLTEQESTLSVPGS